MLPDQQTHRIYHIYIYIYHQTFVSSRPTITTRSSSCLSQNWSSQQNFIFLFLALLFLLFFRCIFVPFLFLLLLPLLKSSPNFVDVAIAMNFQPHWRSSPPPHWRSSLRGEAKAGTKKGAKHNGACICAQGKT